MSSRLAVPSALFVLTNSALNRGMNTGLENLAWGLAERGMEVHILCGGCEPGSHNFVLPQNVHYHFTGLSGENPASFLPLFRKIAVVYRPQVLIGWIINTALLTGESCANEMVFISNLGQMPPRSITLRFVKAVLHKKMGIFDLLKIVVAIRRYPKLARTVVSISDAVQSESVKRYKLDARKCIVIPRGIDGDVYRYSERGSALQEPVEVLFAGNVQEGKGIGDLVNGLSGVRSRILLRVCGRSEPEYVESLAKIAEASGHEVRWMGPVSQSELVGYYKSCDIFALPSHAEGLGKALLEAMACGCPIVCSDIPAFREVVKDGYDGLVVPARSPNALADAVQRYIDDSGLRKACSRNARRRVEEKFSKEAELNGWLRILQQCVLIDDKSNVSES